MNHICKNNIKLRWSSTRCMYIKSWAHFPRRCEAWFRAKKVLTLGVLNGSRDIATTRNCTQFLKIGFVAAGGGFYSYYINKGNKSDKERKIVRTKISFIHTKRFNTSFKRLQFRVGAIPRLLSSISMLLKKNIHLFFISNLLLLF